MANDELLEELRQIARREGVSLAQVIREGLEWRARRPRARPKFIASGVSAEPPFDTAERSADMQFEPRSWR